jgi:hypothetical protein
MANRAQDVRLFERAARARLAAARFLLEHGFRLDAVYLAGYCIECALKSLILKRTPANVYDDIQWRITHGSRAHDFDGLVAILKRRPINCVVPSRIQFLLRRAGSWSTSLRYQTGTVRQSEAGQFLEGADSIRVWCQEG